MSDKNEINISGGGWSGFWIMIAFLSIAFAGSPDLVDGLLFKLCSGDIHACKSFAVELEVVK